MIPSDQSTIGNPSKCDYRRRTELPTDCNQCNHLQWGARFTSCCDSSRRSWLHWYLLISHYFVVYFHVLSYLVKFYHILPYKWNHLHQGTRTTGCYDSAQRCWSVILEAFLRHSHLPRTISAIEGVVLPIKTPNTIAHCSMMPQLRYCMVWCGLVWYGRGQ